MTPLHQHLIHALIAAQVALLEHANETIGINGKAKKALLECLAEATKLAKKLND